MGYHPWFNMFFIYDIFVFYLSAFVSIVNTCTISSIFSDIFMVKLLCRFSWLHLSRVARFKKRRKRFLRLDSWFRAQKVSDSHVYITTCRRYDNGSAVSSVHRRHVRSVSRRLLAGLQLHQLHQLHQPDIQRHVLPARLLRWLRYIFTSTLVIYKLLSRATRRPESFQLIFAISFFQPIIAFELSETYPLK